jgi:lysophospholipase L1-like esterase
MKSLILSGSNPLAQGELLGATHSLSDRATLQVSKQIAPNKIEGLVAWYDASDSTTLTSVGTLVSQWSDKSGNGNHLTQSTDSKKPKTGTTTINGVNAVEFDGTSDYLSIPSGLYSLSNGNSTVLAAIQYTSIASSSVLFAFSNGGVSRYRVQARDVTNNYMSAQNYTSSSTNIAPNAVPLKTGTPTIIGLARRDLAIIPISSGVLGGITYPAVSFVSTIGSVGAFPTEIQWFNGYLGELMFFNRALSNEEINLMGQYLQRKWGATWVNALSTQNKLKNRNTFVGFGDSITVGTSGVVTSYNSWMKRVASSMRTVATNKGISGTVLQNSNDASGFPRTGNGRDRYIADLTGANKKDAALILYGFNDLRYTGGGDMSIANFLSDYQEIITGLLSSGYEASDIFMGSPPWGSDLLYENGSVGFTGSNRTIHEQYVAGVKLLCQTNGTLYAPVYEYMRDNGGSKLISSDNIHPNDDGHEVIANAFFDANVIL